MRRVKRGAFATSTLTETLAAAALTRQDRALVTDLVYGTLRHLIRLGACLRQLVKRPGRLPPDVSTALELGAYEVIVRQTPRYAAVHTWVEEVKAMSPRHGALANAVLRRIAEPRGLAEAERLSLPQWLYTHWRELFGTEVARSIGASLLEPEPLWLTALNSDAALELSKEGCEVRPGPVEGTLAVRLVRPLEELAAFNSGSVQPQNPASALVPKVLGVTQGERVLDLCSGVGIKSAQLAAAGAEVLAVELSARKIGAAKANLRRLGLTAAHLQADLRSVPQVEPSARVLLDAPCTGTGTLRGNPDIKLRLSQQAVSDAASLQSSLLDTAADLTAANGRLVYAVCSLTKSEGITAARDFLGRHSSFTAEEFDVPVDSLDFGEGRYILPNAGLDGFFIASFVKGRN